MKFIKYVKKHLERVKKEIIKNIIIRIININIIQADIIKKLSSIRKSTNYIK